MFCYYSLSIIRVSRHEWSGLISRSRSFLPSWYRLQHNDFRLAGHASSFQWTETKLPYQRTAVLCAVISQMTCSLYRNVHSHGTSKEYVFTTQQDYNQQVTNWLSIERKTVHIQRAECSTSTRECNRYRMRVFLCSLRSVMDGPTRQRVFHHTDLVMPNETWFASEFV